jgi:hypothetical protein
VPCPQYDFANPGAIAVSNGKVWVANGPLSGIGSVTELSASNGQLIKVIDGATDGIDGPDALGWSERT